ncbi:hypothetical protein C0J52_26805 [Blattella germanica]|nr:hypothetical protein C0J52_26805 [Blattella germanica]
MGGLFSRTEEIYVTPQQQWHHTSSQSQWLQRQEEISRQEEVRRANELRRLKEQEELRRKKQIQIEALRRKRTQSLVSISRRHICDAVLRDEIAANWSPMSVGQSTIKVNIPEDDIEYRLVMNGFKHTTKKGFNIVKIERIQNPHLLGCYLLKKLEMTSMFGSVREELVYHGTKQCNITSICENNFDWRLHGESIGNRFGKGVSFSPISNYASHYSDKYTPIKIMFRVRVLISKDIIGSQDMILPPYIGRWDSILRFDTTKKENGQVIVKYCDNEFYPEYLIHYTRLELKNTFNLVTEKMLFRGTEQRYVHSICEDNFNWRLQEGVNSRNKFGKGVSFNTSAYNATFYSDKDSMRKMMFLARVLVSKETQHDPDMIVPPKLLEKWPSNSNQNNVLRFDTTRAHGGKICVKYSDNDFYPQYLIHYTEEWPDEL